MSHCIAECEDSYVFFYILKPWFENQLQRAVLYFFYLLIVFYIISDVLVLFLSLHRVSGYQKLYCVSGEIYFGAANHIIPDPVQDLEQAFVSDHENLARKF